VNPDLIKQNQIYDEPQKMMSLLPNYYRWIYKYARPYLNGTVLELGCGEGHFLHHYVNQVDMVIAVDYNSTLLRQVEAKFKDWYVQTMLLDLRSDWNAVSQIYPDVIIALDVLEHFEDDKAFVEKVRSKLKPDGKFIVKVPAQRGLFSEMDRASGHYRRYDENDLRNLLESCGFSVITLRYMNPMGALAYRIKRGKRSNFSRTFSSWQLKLINIGLVFLPMFDRFLLGKGLSLFGVFSLKN